MLAIALLSVTAARAADEPPDFADSRDDSSRYAVETVVDGLDNPTSLAVRPGTLPADPYEIYISETSAGRVVRVLTVDEPQPAPAITGFPVIERDDQPAERVGPMGLVFLTPNRLAVGTAGLGDGADLVRIYSLPDDDAEQSYDQADHSGGPVPASNRTKSGEGVFASLATSEDALFVVPRSGAQRGWVLKATLDANRIAGLEPFFAASEILGVANSAAVAVDPRPQHHYLLVALSGKPDGLLDSRLAMLAPTSGKVAMTLETGLRDVVALAYSPSGDLYAADFATSDPQAGGVYRLEAAQVDGRESCRAVKIAAVTRPTALAFTSDGSLFVTSLGALGGTSEKPAGQLLKITPQGDAPKL